MKKKSAAPLGAADPSINSPVPAALAQAGQDLRRNPRPFLRAALIVVAYLFAFIILDLITHQFEELRGIVAWYPPVGLTYTLLLVFGVRFAPVVTIALLIDSIFIYRMPQPPYLLFLWAFIISLIYGGAAAFLRHRIRFDWQLRKLRDVTWLVVTTVLVSALLAVFSVSSSALLSSDLPRSEVLRSIFLWWIGETVGVLTVTPFLLIHVMPWLKQFAEGQPVRSSARRSFPRPTLSAIGQAVSIALTLYWVFGAPVPNEYRPLYLITLPLIWIALQRGFKGVSAAIVVLNFGVVLALWLFRFDLARLGELELLMIANCIVGLFMGAVVTERKRTEETLQEREQRLRFHLENSPMAVVEWDTDYIVMQWLGEAEKIFGWSRAETIGKPIMDLGLIYEEDIPIVQNVMQRLTDGISRHVVSTNRNYTKDGKVIYCQWYNSVLLNPQDKMVSVMSQVLDITERKHGEERIRRQLEHLTALSAIDRVIAGNFDLKLSLSEILAHVTIELGVDAADILILNSSLHMLEYGTERGFRSKTVRKAHVRLGESYAGRVALERQLVQIPNLRDIPDNLSLTTLLAGEDFVCYYGVPLIIKGQVNGVLEVFHRAALEPDEEWFDFLYALAGQAAIAIDNSTLFESLQRSNLDLTLAYDATIEGWSRALDLRDKETEGHTQRVTEMTVKLVRTFGLGEAELVQVRWGALLHDIGKMGVPDGILLKPGPLTDEEWVVMKKHPTFAYELLSPIDYLRLALDIPYCHHEKWDGTGYPQGLKSEQIPLVARIFSVVDVWDALTSDRPYRQAWPEAKARQYIQEQEGLYFDPQIVRAFMKENFEKG